MKRICRMNILKMYSVNMPEFLGFRLYVVCTSTFEVPENNKITHTRYYDGMEMVLNRCIGTES